jgi:Uma2 family endonuclease
MNVNFANKPVSEQDYLQGEQLADTKHELINGQVYVMGEANENHNLLAGNILAEFKCQLKGKTYRVFMVDMKVKVGHDFYYPDVMVVCQQDHDSAYYKNAPVIIVEVLSKPTRRFDQTDKRLRYQQIPSLEEYVLIEQDKGEIVVFNRQNHWQSVYYYLGDDITFASLGVTMRVEDIYYQVDNDDVLEFLLRKGV